MASNETTARALLRMLATQVHRDLAAGEEERDILVAVRRRADEVEAAMRREEISASDDRG